MRLPLPLSVAVRAMARLASTLLALLLCAMSGAVNIRVLEPKTGTVWKGNGFEKIFWDQSWTQETIAYVRVQYGTSTEGPWTIIDNHASNWSGYVSWSIPSTIKAGTYYVYIEDVDDFRNAGISSQFTIQAYEPYSPNYGSLFPWWTWLVIFVPIGLMVLVFVIRCFVKPKNPYAANNYQQMPPAPVFSAPPAAVINNPYVDQQQQQTQQQQPLFNQGYPGFPAAPVQQQWVTYQNHPFAAQPFMHTASAQQQQQPQNTLVFDPRAAPPPHYDPNSFAASASAPAQQQQHQQQQQFAPVTKPTDTSSSNAPLLGKNSVDSSGAPPGGARVPQAVIYSQYQQSTGYSEQQS